MRSAITTIYESAKYARPRCWITNTQNNRASDVVAYEVSDTGKKYLVEFGLEPRTLRKT